MDPALQELFTHIITDHYKNPRNVHALEHPTRVLKGENPLCGDRISLSLLISEGIVRDIALESQGCGLSTASASILTEAIKGKSFAEITSLRESVAELVQGVEHPEEPLELTALSLAAGNPARIACVMLAWDLVKALE